MYTYTYLCIYIYITYVYIYVHTHIYTCIYGLCSRSHFFVPNIDTRTCTHTDTPTARIDMQTACTSHALAHLQCHMHTTHARSTRDQILKIRTHIHALSHTCTPHRQTEHPHTSTGKQVSVIRAVLLSPSLPPSPLSLARSLALSLPLSHTHTLLSLSHMHIRTHAHTQTHKYTLTHTHAHVHTYVGARWSDHRPV